MKRNPEAIERLLERRGDKVYTKARLAIEFPSWYEDKELMTVNEHYAVFGIFAIVSEDTYCVSIAPSMIHTAPLLVSKVEREGVEYTRFEYAAGSCLVENVKLVKRELVSYTLFENFYLQARIPWFLEYDDMVTVMNNQVKYSGTRLGENMGNSEFLIAYISRRPEDRNVFYRTKPVGRSAYVDLMDVFHSTQSTLSKIGGNYFKDSLASALLNKSREVTNLEAHVRK